MSLNIIQLRLFAKWKNSVKYLKTVFLLCYVVFHVNTLSVGNAQEASNIPKNVETALNSNAKDMNQISLFWKQTRTTNMDFDLFFKRTNALYDRGLLEPQNFFFSFRDNKFTLLSTIKDVIKRDIGIPQAWKISVPLASDVKKQGIELSERVQEVAFDGKRFYSGTGSVVSSENSPGIEILPLEDIILNKNPSRVNQQYTIKMGFKYPNCGSEVGSSCQSYILFLIKSGQMLRVEQVKLNNENYLYLEIKAKSLLDWNRVERIFSFWLDPRMNYAVKQLDIKSIDGKICYHIENDDFIKLENRTVFIPRKTQTVYYTYYETDDIFETSLFTEISLLADISSKKVSEKNFDISKKYTEPSTYVFDKTLSKSGEGIGYLVPANPADLDRVIESALTDKDFTPTPLPSRAAIIIRWIMILAGISMILYAGYRKFIQKI
ncbi:MAG: hypothetical protein LBJ67_09045 [Planctomycetaceae bacterium]|jgi:hypothetical protein|nr:hypothetical protein [Planctomycetaceae bacterium]